MASEHDALFALPQLTADDLIPEITSLRLGASGRLERVERRQPLIVTYVEMGRRVTARVSFQPTVELEIGCRLARLPFSVEAPRMRGAVLGVIDRIQRAGVGRLGLTPRQELHLSDHVALGSGRLGSDELLYALVVVGLGLRPVFSWLDAIPLPRP